MVGRKRQRAVYFEAPRLEHSEPEPFYDIVRTGRIRHTPGRTLSIGSRR